MIDCYITLFKPPINMCSNKMNWLITWHHRFCYFNGFLILFPLMHSHRFKLFLVTFTSSSAFFLWKSESLCSDDSSEWFDFMNNAIFFFLRWEKDWGYEVTGQRTLPLHMLFCIISLTLKRKDVSFEVFYCWLASSRKMKYVLSYFIPFSLNIRRQEKKNTSVKKDEMIKCDEQHILIQLQ